MAEKPASAPKPADRMAGAARAFSVDDGLRRTLLAAVAGGVVALILMVLLQAIGLLPSPGRTAANQAVEQAKSAVDTATVIDRRVTAIETMVEGLPALKTDTRAVTDRVAALEAERPTFATRTDVEAVANTLAALRKEIDARPPSATRDYLNTVTERLGRLEVTAAAGGSGGASDAALASLSDQLAQAEAGLRSLTDRLAVAEAKAASTGGTVASGEAVRAIAVGALRRAADGDQPFAADVDMVSALGVAGDDITSLRAIAEKGVASKTALAAAFPAVGDAILSATAVNPNAGFWERLWGGVTGLVSIRPVGPVAGGDPAAIVSRMNAALATGDLAAALAEREALPQAGKDASAEWAAKAADRAALDALVERIADSLATAKS